MRRLMQRVGAPMLSAWCRASPELVKAHAVAQLFPTRSVGACRVPTPATSPRHVRGTPSGGPRSQASRTWTGGGRDRCLVAVSRIAGIQPDTSDSSKMDSVIDCWSENSPTDWPWSMAVWSASSARPRGHESVAARRAAARRPRRVVHWPASSALVFHCWLAGRAGRGPPGPCRSRPRRSSWPGRGGAAAEDDHEGGTDDAGSAAASVRTGAAPDTRRAGHGCSRSPRVVGRPARQVSSPSVTKMTKVRGFVSGRIARPDAVEHPLMSIRESAIGVKPDARMPAWAAAAPARRAGPGWSGSKDVAGGRVEPQLGIEVRPDRVDLQGVRAGGRARPGSRTRCSWPWCCSPCSSGCRCEL